MSIIAPFGKKLYSTSEEMEDSGVRNMPLLAPDFVAAIVHFPQAFTKHVVVPVRMSGKPFLKRS